MKKAVEKKIAKLNTDMSELFDYFQTVVSEMQESYDAKSERWQESDAGEAMQQEISNLEDLASNIESLIDSTNNFEIEY